MHISSYDASDFNHMHAQSCIGIQWEIGIFRKLKFIQGQFGFAERVLKSASGPSGLHTQKYFQWKLPELDGC